MDYTYNQVITYIDGTRDLDFEGAQKWAKKKGTTFVEQEDKREPYTESHQETWTDENGEVTIVTTNTPTTKRYFVIGPEPEPEPYSPPDSVLQSIKRDDRNNLLQDTQNKIDRYHNQLALGVDTTDSEDTYKKLLAYTQYLRDYPNGDMWWKESPLDFDMWLVG